MSVAEERIERFLRENPAGTLRVIVGYASAFGLAWLDEQTSGRRVELLIGDTRQGFNNIREADRRAAIRFIERSDVSVRNWYSKQDGYRTAHAKVWIVQRNPADGSSGAILVGSANLTKQGLLHNVEILALAHPEEHARLYTETNSVWSKSWCTEDRLLGLLNTTGARHDDRRGSGSAVHPSPRRVPPQAGGRRGDRHRHRPDPRRRPSAPAHSRRSQLKRAAIMVIAGGLLLAALPSILDRIADSSNPTNSPDNGAAAPAPLPPTPPEPTPDAEPPTVSPAPTDEPQQPEDTAARTPEPTPDAEAPTVSPAPTDEPQQPEDTAAQTPEPAPEAEASTTSPVAPPPPTAVAPAPAAAETSTDPPNVETTVPPEGWEPEVSGNASSYGEPDRSDLQWVAWQPNCPSCEPGVTMSWVGSFAYPYNGPIGYTNDFRPKLQSACAHRVRSGPLIDWKVDIGGDQVDALWVDGNEVPAGSWWLLDRDGVGDNPSVMVPEPEPFLALLQDAKELRVLTVEGRDATFAVEGFLTTPVQANLDHCSHYP